MGRSFLTPTKEVGQSMAISLWALWPPGSIVIPWRGVEWGVEWGRMGRVRLECGLGSYKVVSVELMR